MTEESNGTLPMLPTNVHISKHPILSHKITILRSSSTTPAAFRSVLRELTFHLGYEATSTLTTKPIPITVPVGHDHMEYTGSALMEKVALIPILRSGLGMVDSMLELMPNAAVHHIGMYRRDMMPVQYYNRLPRKCESDVAYILDPIIATSNTVMSVIGILKKVCTVCFIRWVHALLYVCLVQLQIQMSNSKMKKKYLFVMTLLYPNISSGELKRFTSLQ
jgi:uracil phosphoribosyltransferase